MTDTEVDGARARGAHRSGGGGGGSGVGDTVRFVLRGIGQTLITLGLVVLLFVVYEVWITNLSSERANRQVVQKLEKTWDNPTLPLPADSSSIPSGTGLAVLYIPRLGRDYHFGVVEGTNQDDLSRGPGHYSGTALPGRVGNFAVAGHRVGKGEPFLNIDKLRSGDAVIVETKTYWYVYRVLGSPAGRNPEQVTQTIPVRGGGTVRLPGREIVDPSAGRVLEPVPDHAKADPADRLMTMTTCHPKFTAARRMIVYARLTGTPLKVGTTAGKRDDAMPASIAQLYDEVQA